jgi:hypothetical protein
MTRDRNFHEDLAREERPKGPSDRAFGLTFSVLFVVIAGIAAWRGSQSWIWWVAAGAIAAAVAVVVPRVLTRLNSLWMAFGLLLFKVVSPLMLGIVFFGVMMPIGLLMRTRKDLLSRKIDAKLPTYWIRREPPGPTPESMSNQF